MELGRVYIRRLSRRLAGVGAAVKYAVLIGLFILIIAGAYYTGYRVGSSDKQVEYVTKQVEGVKYVSQKKAEIYAKPNAGHAELLKLMYDGKL